MTEKPLPTEMSFHVIDVNLLTLIAAIEIIGFLYTWKVQFANSFPRNREWSIDIFQMFAWLFLWIPTFILMIVRGVIWAIPETTKAMKQTFSEPFSFWSIKKR